MTLNEFKEQFGNNAHRNHQLLSLENFYTALQSKYSHYRTLAYGSFITEKEYPSDIDIMICIASTLTDPGFSKHTKAQEFADDNLDIFTISLKYSFVNEVAVPTPEEMKEKFNSLENHVENGIMCESFVEICF